MFFFAVLERWWQARTQGGGGGGSPLPMNPPRSFKFRFNMFKINGMRARRVRARFRDRSRPCFIACACDVHSTFKDLIVAERAKPCTCRSTCSPERRVAALSGRGQADHFGAKW